MQLLALPVESLEVALAESEPAVMAATLMQSRQTILPRYLVAPGPDPLQLGMVLNAAASNRLWRLLRIPGRPLQAKWGDERA